MKIKFIPVAVFTVSVVVFITAYSVTFSNDAAQSGPSIRPVDASDQARPDRPVREEGAERASNEDRPAREERAGAPAEQASNEDRPVREDREGAPTDATASSAPAQSLENAANDALGQQTEVTAPRITVIDVTEQEYQAQVKGYGEAVSHYQVTYGSDVSGRVTAISSSFATGEIVRRGAVLATVDQTTYLQAVALAESNLAQARLDLLEEERTGEQARLQWERSGLEGDPSSELVLREPQLAVAQAAFANAQASLETAEQNLAKTTITAPFDALVVERTIQPGSYLQAGGTVGTFYSTNRVEVEVPLSIKQWQNLPQLNNVDLANEENRLSVTLIDSEGTQSWEGYVIRVEQHVNTDSRQRSIVVAVDQPFEFEVGLFPGTFVQAFINGRVVENIWSVPSSAITQEGEIWYVDDNNLLAKATPETYFEESGFVYVAPVNNLTSAQIVLSPLSHYVVGMKVQPNTEG